MKLWLDDVRNPALFGCLGWHWVRTAQEAIAWLSCQKADHGEEITQMSLDHDLGWESTVGLEHTKEMTGYDVVLFLEENPRFWPKDGTHVHSANPVGRSKMLVVIDRHYKK